MRYRIFFLLLLFAVLQAGAQNVVNLSREVCDSIDSVDPGRNYATVVAQYKLQREVLRNYPEIFVADSIKTGLKKQNKFMLDLVRQLSRSCPAYNLDDAFLSGETGILDLEGLFSPEQIDTIQLAIDELRNDRDFGIFIVSVDDLFPYNNLKEFAIGAGYVWSVGGGLSKGGTVVAFSKNLKRVRISTSSLSKKFLSDKDAQSLIDKVLLPKFSRGKYYDAMTGLIKKLMEEL